MKENKAREIFLKAVSDRTRYGIIECLSDGPKSVNEMKSDCRLDQTLVSYHLKYLRSRGFVDCVKKGKLRIYSLDKEVVAPVLNALDKGMVRYRKKMEKRR